MKKILLLVVVLLVTAWKTQALDLIPQPKKLTENAEVFLLKPSTQVLFKQASLSKQADLYASMLSPSTAYQLVRKQAMAAAPNSIFLSLEPSMKNAEAYKLKVSQAGVEISAGSEKGLFYGFQTLLQLAKDRAVYSKRFIAKAGWEFHGAEIEDAPEFKWRGVMLDFSRYFLHKEYVIKYIDLMAMYKLNVLHMHLIDDAGWRLEIKKYPKLTSIGAWRGEKEKTYGGFYTQEDIKEIVAYAAQRSVEVVPEIELPAHVHAAIVAYPYLSCEKKSNQKVQVQHSIDKMIYCAGKETTYEFLENVFKEVFELFPSKYIHIGGDEADYGAYEKCPDCQAKMKQQKLKKASELQVYMNQRIQKLLTQNGKVMLGWDEIIEPGLKNKVAGMIWKAHEKTAPAVKAGHDVVMALSSNLYFDFAYNRIPGEIKAATWLPPIALEKVYNMKVIAEDLAPKYHKQVLGPHACLWTDQFISGTILQEFEILNENRSEQYCDYLSNPRLMALAEIGWVSEKDKNWFDFRRRTKSHYAIYDHAEYGYSVPLPILKSITETKGGYLVTLETAIEGASIHYTTNESKPNSYSKTYTQPILVRNLRDLKAITVVNHQQFSLPLNVSYQTYY